MARNFLILKKLSFNSSARRWQHTRRLHHIDLFLVWGHKQSAIIANFICKGSVLTLDISLRKLAHVDDPKPLLRPLHQSPRGPHLQRPLKS